MAKLNTNFSQRLQQSRMVAALITIIGLFFGLWFCINAVTDLMEHEQNAINHAKTLAEGKNTVISVDVDRIDMNNNNKLIHIIGETSVDEIIMDDLFKVEVVNVIKLRRIVQMYQWQKEEDDYKKVWSEQSIDSAKFFNSKYHNPTMSSTSKVMIARQVILGDFIIPNTLVMEMDHYQKLPMKGLWEEQENLRRLFSNQKIHFIDGTYYIGKDLEQPEIGDLKLSFAAVLPENISIIANQQSQLTPYITETGGSIEMFEYGIVTSRWMFKNARIKLFINNIQPRLKGFFTIFIGIYIIFHVLWIASPSLLEPNNFRGWLLALIVAIAFTFAVIAFSWHDYSSIFGKALFIVSIIILYFLKFSYKPRMLMPETTVPRKEY
ncbi:TMEM43 family protein [Candidatus Halobeggiatoa sp. HSG11]|nr:TMEM43 family protein [Candidatus Halobeggiatoa sp. HSG11]